MKVNAFGTIPSYKLNPIFTGTKDDELVHVPLLWDQEDTFSSQNPKFYDKDSKAATEKSSKFKKIGNKVAVTTAGIAVVPTAVEKTAELVDSTLKNTSNSVKSSMETIAEIKNQAKDLFGKTRTDGSSVKDESEYPIEEGSVSDDINEDTSTVHDGTEDSDHDNSDYDSQTDLDAFDFDYSSII